MRYMEELRTRDSLDLLSQTEQINYLENKVRQLAKLDKSYSSSKLVLYVEIPDSNNSKSFG